MPRYEIRPPSLPELGCAARELRRRDDAGIDAADFRDHCTRLALTPAWRTRDKLRAPEWPAQHDETTIHTWAAIGASDALAMLPPRATHDNPHARAYQAAYSALLGAYMSEPQITEPEHPALTTDLHPDIVYNLVVKGDMSGLTEGQRVAYYAYRCHRLGIDPAEQPFSLIRLNGKLVLYLDKGGAAAITRVNGLSHEIKSRSRDGSLIIVEVRCSGPDGRFEDDIGVVDMDDESLTLANAIMKCVSKAKRRSTIALVGEGTLDVTEVDTIRGAERVPMFGEPSSTALPKPALVGPTECRHAAEIRQARVAYAILIDADFARVYTAVCKACKVPAVNGGAPEPEQLTDDDGANVLSKLQAAIAKAQREVIDPEILPARQPGEDDPADVEPPADWTGHGNTDDNLDGMP